MTLQIKEGDLFANAKAPCIIIHGCNAQGKMGSGFAYKLRNKYPDAYTAYKKVQAVVGLNLGDVSTIKYMNGLIIANAVTQQFYGNDPERVYVDYEAVEKALTRAAEYSAKKALPVHLPFIGGGKANGDREKLLEIFKRVFENTNATLWLN